MSRLHPDDRQRVLAALRAYLEGREREYNLEFRLRHKDGTYRWIYTRGVALRDATGQQTHMLGCHLDITEWKQLQEQYRQSQKMEAVGQLAGGIAHDFNNLLTVIKGYAELVEQELGPAHRAHRDLEEIRAAAKKAAGLTRQLLAFSRRQILQPQVVDLNQVLRNMQRMLAILGEDLTIVMNLTAGERVSADPGQIEQVIMNLAVNARDAMPGGGRLVIETADVVLDSVFVARHPGARPGKHVLVTVSDTGTGMDEATCAHVFEPFFTTKPEGRGTGLGLATVYGIVKQSGGSIWVDSEVGTGTTFQVFLPVATGGVDVHPPSADPKPRQGTETVLVIEDQEEVRAVIDRTLRQCGYTVIAASDGPQAIIAARTHDGPIHLLLTDVVLPTGNGRDVARQVLADRPSVRVLYMSGYAQTAILHEGTLEAGLAFIQKPFSGETLAARVRAALDANPSPRY